MHSPHGKSAVLKTIPGPIKEIGQESYPSEGCETVFSSTRWDSTIDLLCRSAKNVGDITFYLGLGLETIGGAS